jgi:hypothetical protein
LELPTTGSYWNYLPLVHNWTFYHWFIFELSTTGSYLSYLYIRITDSNPSSLSTSKAQIHYIQSVRI